MQRERLLPYRIGYVVWAFYYARTWFKVWRQNRVSFPPFEKLQEEREAQEDFFTNLKFGKHRRKTDG